MSSIRVWHGDDFSLPTQRCFETIMQMIRMAYLFSAYAEVFPRISALMEKRHTFLCLRRGVSELFPPSHGFGRLFSAYAEVFPTMAGLAARISSFLCLRRGVSISHC